MVFSSRKESTEQKTIPFIWTEKCVFANLDEGLLGQYMTYSSDGFR